MITKADEIKVLEKIKKMVEELGSDSYIATAFEGCFEIAEENIRNDFGCSMKQRAEAAEKKAESYKKQLAEATKHNEEFKQLESKVLSDKDVNFLSDILKHDIIEIERHTKSFAKDIVKYAETPASTDFREAVRLHRECERKAGSYTALYNRLNKAYNENK